MNIHARKAAFHSLGCKVNSYETEAMQQELEQAGYEIVPFEPGADIYVINTCSVTNVADRKSRQMLHKARKMNPDAVVVAAGCYVQTAKEKTGLAVEADIILGNDRKRELAAALAEYYAGEDALTAHHVEQLIDINKGTTYEKLAITKTEEHTRAYIKVQDGCNQFCSYCIIPYARGRVRSRQMEDVMTELRALAANGIHEVVLTGIHLSSYGLEIGTDLLSLIRAAATVPGIDRIRLGSLEQGIITEEFARGVAEIEEFCPHFHLSLQSGCDTVLERMNRRYTSAQFAERCDLLREVFDDPALTTDVIVGFPQETEEEFQQTVEFLKKIQFYETHIFKYSMRKGTVAARMDGQIQESVKGERSDVLLALNRMHKAQFEERRIGKKVSALFEEKITADGKTFYTGYTKEYIRTAICTEQDLTNKVVAGTLQREGAPKGAMLFVPDGGLII